MHLQGHHQCREVFITDYECNIPVEERVTDFNKDKSVEMELDAPEEAPRM